MKTRLRQTLGLLVLSTLTLSSVPATAQTTANGFYYPVPSWDQTLPGSNRFIILSNFNSEAVMDRETGLVWERSPGDVDRDGDVDSADRRTWAEARVVCAHQRIVGSRKAWRLPSFAELASLLDTSIAPPGPLLSPGHPFRNIQPTSYWSATTSVDSPVLPPAVLAAWGVAFGDGDTVPHDKTEPMWVWCVRGAMNADQY